MYPADFRGCFIATSWSNSHHVTMGTARKGEGMGSRSHIDTGHSQQLGHSLRGTGQAERGREDVLASIARIGMGAWVNVQITYQHWRRSTTWAASTPRRCTSGLRATRRHSVWKMLQGIDQRLTRYGI
jgi:hypothetical protein